MRTPDTPELAACYLAGNLCADRWEIDYFSGRTGQKVSPNYTNQCDIVVTVHSGENFKRRFCIGEYRTTETTGYSRHEFFKLDPPHELKGE